MWSTREKRKRNGRKMKIKTPIDGSFVRAFCNSPLSKGDFCLIEHGSGYDMVRKYDSDVDDTVHGISLNNIVDLDLTNDFPKEGQVQRGGMINILTRGIVVLKVKEESFINAPVYLTKKGNISTKKKKGRPLVGHICSSPDREGFVQVKVEL
jgi:hypothetical protein